LRTEDVVYEETLPGGFALAEDGATGILLDGRIDDRLRRRGLLRELVHRIQVARKEAGFEVTDRIVLSYEGDGELAAVIEENDDEVAAEVLATEIVAGVSSDVEHREAFDLDGRAMTIGLRRVQ